MERVPTWAKSPYLGMFQYKDAGPDRIHQKSLVPFLLPSSPYLGWFRHDLVYRGMLHSTSRSKSTQTDVGRSKSTQTDAGLSAFVIDEYH